MDEDIAEVKRVLAEAGYVVVLEGTAILRGGTEVDFSIPKDPAAIIVLGHPRVRLIA